MISGEKKIEKSRWFVIPSGIKMNNKFFLFDLIANKLEIKKIKDNKSFTASELKINCWKKNGESAIKKKSLLFNFLKKREKKIPKIERKINFKNIRLFNVGGKFTNSIIVPITERL